MRNIKHLLVAVLALVFLTTACKKDEPTPVTPSEQGFYIINEGAFSQGNASLSFYNTDKDSLINDYYTLLVGRPLGDVFQSMSFNNGRIFFVVNNSQKIEVVDSASFSAIRTITGFTSPRGIYFYKNKAYVTDAQSNKITVLNATTYEKISEISVAGFTDRMVFTEGKFYVTVQQFFSYSEGSLKGLVVLNPETDAIEDYLELREGAYDIVLDANKKIWVMCSGDYLAPVNGALYRINPALLAIEKEFPFTNLAYFGSALKLSADKQSIYFTAPDPSGGFTETDIFKMPVTSNSLPEVPVYDGVDKYIYGYGVNEAKNELYILDAVGGGQKGNLVKVNATTGTDIFTKEVGYFPSNIVFK
jgi:YVTN family beta-propeller protein